MQLSGLFAAGDETRLYATSATRFERSQYVAISHGMALDREGTRLTVQAAYLRSKVFYDLVRGKGWQGGLLLSRPLLQRFGRSIQASLAFDFMNLDNAILIYRLTDDRTRAVRLSLRYSETADNHELKAELGLSQGIAIAGARASEGLGKVDFTKINGRLSTHHMVGSHLAVRMKATAQLTTARLPLVEQISAGGGDFGRAFTNGLINGDDGWAAGVEVAWLPKAIAALTTQELFAFVDTASVHYKRRDPFTGVTYRLASAGIGARLQLADRLGVDFGAARALKSPYPGMGEDWRLFMTARMKFGL